MRAHLPDGHHPAEVHAALREARPRLQRPPLHLRRGTRIRELQGIIIPPLPPIHIYSVHSSQPSKSSSFINFNTRIKTPLTQLSPKVYIFN